MLRDALCRIVELLRTLLLSGRRLVSIIVAGGQYRQWRVIRQHDLEPLLQKTLSSRIGYEVKRSLPWNSPGILML